ncbi:NAD dependent epimerase/dehydratase family protein [Beauveria brongniartii RCEF 3172]|uniref:NAD dependent epimerase/dehydratase family protein n=1 Tax=Beauveria brongniartii RCEF 3172 TaxID=1081107 RepID=A0A166XMT8_9HYPO|nr:NAD dependent epimerase/dehydratase family protein [Beauveria brongniartii RCEF 3172]
MSKQPEEAFIGDGELPPPYSPESSPSSIHADSLFAAHLASLRGQIRAQQASRASRQDQHDTQLLALLVPHVEALLASVAALDKPLVQATLVPEEAIAADWTPAETEDAQRVVRVRTRSAPTKMAGDGKQPAANGGGVTSGGAEQREFDGWGRWGQDAARGGKEEDEGEDKLWWKDENMAKRLARYLQPKRKVMAVDRPTVAAKMAEARKSKSKWNMFGGGRKSGSEGDGSPAPAAASRPDTAVEVADDVSMHVTAEEVTFRRENEMGIWESSTGWGVVVRVKVRTWNVST